MNDNKEGPSWPDPLTHEQKTELAALGAKLIKEGERMIIRAMAESERDAREHYSPGFFNFTPAGAYFSALNLVGYIGGAAVIAVMDDDSGDDEPEGPEAA